MPSRSLLFDGFGKGGRPALAGVRSRMVVVLDSGSLFRELTRPLASRRETDWLFHWRRCEPLRVDVAVAKPFLDEQQGGWACQRASDTTRARQRRTVPDRGTHRVGRVEDLFGSKGQSVYQLGWSLDPLELAENGRTTQRAPDR
jgi:hypothetical protein